LLAKDRALVQANLEAVVVRGIMTAGDHDSRAYVEMEQREVQERSWDHANVDYITSRFSEGARKDFAKARRTLSRVAAQTGARDSICAIETANGARDVVHSLIVEIAADHSTYVVFAKNVFVQ
jgi:hypothetical protein